MVNWKWMVIALVACIFLFLSYVYVKYSLITDPVVDQNQISIQQSSVEDIFPHHLFEKVPIIIMESLSNPIELLQTLFCYLFVSRAHVKKIKKDVFLANHHKYLILFHTYDPEEKNVHKQSIYIMHPKNKKYMKSKSEKVRSQAQYVEIRLRPFQVLILPYGWWYKIPKETENFESLKLHDSASRFFGKYFT